VVSSPPALTPTPDTQEFPPKVVNEREAEKTGVPSHVPYLLIGAGTASFAAYRAIKSRDPTAKILIVGDENRLPYMRPPLSKELWFNEDKAAVEELRFKQWNGRERSLFFELPAFYTPIEQLMDSPKGGISVLQGKRVSRIDAKAQVAHLEDGTTKAEMEAAMLREVENARCKHLQEEIVKEEAERARSLKVEKILMENAEKMEKQRKGMMEENEKMLKDHRSRMKEGKLKLI